MKKDDVDYYFDFLKTICAGDLGKIQRAYRKNFLQKKRYLYKAAVTEKFFKKRERKIKMITCDFMRFYVIVMWITFAIVTILYLFDCYDEDMWLALSIFGSLFWPILHFVLLKALCECIFDRD